MMVRAIPGRPTFQQLARRGLRGFAKRTLGALGDAALTNSLVALAQSAGFAGDDAYIAAAIAMAESGGNPNPPANAERSYGLWQINLPLHPEFKGWNLLDPQTNANAAYSVYRNSPRGFGAWTTYRSGAYLKYLSVPAPPAATPEPPLTIDAQTGLPIEDTAQTPGTIDQSVLPSPPSATNYLLLTGLGIGAYLLSEILFGD